VPVAGFDEDLADFHSARFDAARRTAFALCGVGRPTLPLTEAQLAEPGLAMVD